MDFRILGPLEVLADGEEVRLGGPRQRNMLSALLLSRGEPVALNHLVDVTWEATPPPTADKQIRNIASDLRRRLGRTAAAIVPAGSGYRLEIAADDMDATVFARRVTAARGHATDGRPADGVSEFRAALDLWRGPALAGLTSTALQPQLTRLNEDRLAALEECFDLALADGQHRTLTSELAEWVGAYPLRERLAAQLMLALYRADRQADALAAYERTRRSLADQLGIDPGPRLRDIRQRVLLNDPELVWRPPAARLRSSRRDLPRDVSHFTGRTRELRELVGRVTEPPRSAPAMTVCTIDGMAGVGKTAFAVHAAHRLSEWYPDAQLFVDLRGHTSGHRPLSPSAALDKMLHALGVPLGEPPAELDERAALWRATVARRRVLVLLDNAVDSEQIQPLLPGTPGCLTIVTSRQRLTGLAGAHVVSLDVLPPAEARSLFVDGVGDQRVWDEPAELEEIVRMCGHLPLALSIAAARLRHRPAWTLAHMADRLRDRRQRLAVLQSRELDVAAAFAMSFPYLSQAEQRLFCLLGTAPGLDFDPEAASALADLPRREVEDQLERLVDAHLVRESVPGRFHLHDLLRAYAAEQEPGTPERRRAATVRLLDHYLRGAAAAMRVVAPQPDDPHEPVPSAASTPQRGLNWLELEYHNLFALADHALRHGWPAYTYRLSAMLWQYFHIVNRHEDGLALHELAVSAARAAEDRAAEAGALCLAGEELWGVGRYDEAAARFRASIALAREIGDAAVEARSRHGLGLCACGLGRSPEAIDHFRSALAIARRIGDRLVECFSLHGLGGVHLWLGNYAEAARRYEPAIALGERIGQSMVVGFALEGLGMANVHLGRFGPARTFLERALVVGRDSRQRVPEGRALRGLGVLYARQGAVSRAETYLRQALLVAGEMRDRLLESRALCELGLVILEQGAPDEAFDHLRRGLAVSRESRDRTAEALALNALGRAEHRTGDLPSAVDRFHQALSAAAETGGQYEEASAHDGLAAVHQDDGRPREAERHWRQAERIFAELGVPDADRVRASLAELRRGSVGVRPRQVLGRTRRFEWGTWL